MKRKFTKLMAALALLVLVTLPAVGWGQTRTEEVYSTCLFGSDYNSQSVGSYTATWLATNGDFTWTIVNGNNNNNGWNYVKFGRKSNASVGQITTAAAYSEAITKVELTIDAITANKINSIKLYSGTSADSISTLVGEFTKATGTQTVAIANPTEDLFYDIKFDCASGSSNGLVTVSKVEYYYNAGGNLAVVTPTFTPNGGSFLDSQEVSISCATEGATVYYTLDGSTPTTSSTQYTTPFTLTQTTTVKAFAVKANYDDSDVATAVFTKETPMTVAEARDYIDGLNGATSTEDVYVEGIISQIDSYNSTYHSITYWISDDGTTTDQMEVYSGKGLNGADFNAITDLTLGSIVIVKGKVKLYGSTYEFTQNSQIVSLTLPANPYITADNVEIAYDAEEDEIEYTINNSVNGGVLTASTTAEWLTIGTVGETVPFTCSVNNAASSRVATVTLTYTYNRATVTKDVTVTQAGNPNFVNNISDITEVGTSYSVRGTVVAINSRGFVMGDGTGYVYYYKNAAVSQSVNDMVKVSGTTGTYGQIIQFTNTATVTEATTSNYNNTPAATVITAVPDYSNSYHLSTYLEFEGALEKSSNNYFITLGENQIQISYPTSDQGTTLTALDGKNVHVKGYFSGINSSSKFTVMLESAVEVVVPVISIDPATATSFTYVQGAGPSEEQVFEVTGTNLTSNDIIATITTGADYFEITDDQEYSSTVTVNSGDAISVRMKAGLELGNNYAGVLTLTNDGAQNVTIELSGSVTGVKYAISVDNQITGGTIEADKASAAEGETVTLTAHPDASHTFGSWTVYQDDMSTEVTVTDNQFTMPACEVYVTATFEEKVDYATLPFNWAGGPKADLLALTGVTGNGLGSDYAASNAPYRVKFDTDGDYILIKTNVQPGVVTVGIKKLGGADNSKIIIKESTTGESFTNVETFELTGDANAVVNIETNVAFNANTRFVQIYFNKTGSNVGVGPITIAQHVVTYVVNLNQPQQGQGTIAADKAEAAEGETVTLTATPNTGYAFDSWTVLDGGANEVIVTNNTFIMPASDVEVEGIFTALDKHNIVIPEAIENNVIVDATGNQAYANETVTITIEAPANKVLAALTVTGNSSNNNITIDPEVSPYVDEYTFTMPDENVTINATFDNAPSFTVSFSVNGTVDDNLEVSVTQGQSTALPTSSTQTPEGFAITGWAATNGSAEAVADPYTPTADITLFAILGQTIPHSLVINSSTPNFPTSYGTANTFTEYNLGGKNFMIQQGYINGGKLQWRASGNNNGTGTMYNSEDLGKINTIILVYDSSDGNKNFTIKAGTAENPTSGDNITPTFEENSLVYTFDLSQGDYNYFVMTNGSGAGYLQSISIDYVADLNVNTITHIATSTTYTTDIPETTCVVVESGAVLTLNGTNNGTVDNLIIEDGGQLVTSNPVAATMQKNIAGYNPSAKSVGGWYFISSPLAATTTSVVANTNLTSGEYDLYRFNQNAAAEWENWKQTGDHYQFDIESGRGYLYANEQGVPATFTGEVRASAAGTTFNKEINYTDGKRFAGWNLVGNPFPTNASVNLPYYKMNSATDGLNPTANLANGVIAPMEGVFVEASTTTTQVTFTATTASVTAAATAKGAVNLNVESEGELLDRAIVTINGTGMLGKLNLNETATKLYITQNGKDYAVVNAQAQGEMPVNFKASKDGSYTITVDAENLEMGYLHLIDNMTGANVDLLATPSYTFEAKTTDYASRFRLVFNANEENGASTGSETFAFFNGSEWMISNTGNATLQVIDVLGRVLSSETISGTVTVSLKETAGVYMLRLVNGNDVKVQKVVVR